MEIKVNNCENYKSLRKNTLYRIKIRFGIEKSSSPIEKLHFSREIHTFIRKIVFFLSLFVLFKIFETQQRLALAEVAQMLS